MAHPPERNRVACPLTVDEGCLRTTEERRPLETDETCPLVTDETCPLVTDETCPLETDETCPLVTDETCPLETAEVIARDAGVIALSGRVGWCTRYRVTSPAVVDGPLEAGWIDRRPIESVADAAAGYSNDRLTAFA